MLFLGYDDEPPNGAKGSPLLNSGSAFCCAAFRNLSRSRMAPSASRSSFSLASSALFLPRPILMRGFAFLFKQNHSRAASRARSPKAPKIPPTIAPTGGEVVSLGRRVGDAVVVAFAEVAESGMVEEGEEAEVDVDFAVPVDLIAEVDLVAAEDVDVTLVERGIVLVVLDRPEVFAVMGLLRLLLLLLSSPQTPVSQGLVEQHPVNGPLAQR